jgi:hypothetical protein
MWWQVGREARWLADTRERLRELPAGVPVESACAAPTPRRAYASALFHVERLGRPVLRDVIRLDPTWELGTVASDLARLHDCEIDIALTRAILRTSAGSRDTQGEPIDVRRLGDTLTVAWIGPSPPHRTPSPSLTFSFPVPGEPVLASAPSGP